MNILYIHGWGSRFDPTSDKILLLSEIGNVTGVDVDYTQPISEIQETIYNAMIADDIDLLVGTSMGGYMANLMGTTWSVPYVMINPATDPAISLQEYIGSGIDYYDRHYTLNIKTLTSFYKMSDRSKVPGLLLLDMDDDVCDAVETNQMFKNSEHVKTFTWTNGSHRFDHMPESLSLIEDFDARNLSYGFGDN